MIPFFSFSQAANQIIPMIHRIVKPVIQVILIFIVISCKKDNVEPEVPPALKGMQATWNERMKQEGSHAPAASPMEAWFTLDDVIRMKNAGANCLEIHQLGIPDLMPERNIINEEFFSNWVDIWVDWCTQNEMYCILTITGFGAQADWAIYLSLPVWLWEDIVSPPTNKTEYDAVIRDFFNLDVTSQDINRSAFISLWKYIVNRYKENSFVIYSIMNEPFCQVEIPDGETAIHLGDDYSEFMEQIVDTIRSAGSKQTIIIDMPFLWDSYWQRTIQPVNRDDIVWESHAYVAPWGSPTLESWKEKINQDIQKITLEFQKPLFIGEYGIAPISEIRTTYADSWQSILQGQVAYLDSLELFGRQYHCWDDMYGEYAVFGGGSDLTSEESEWIIETVISD